MDYIDPVLIPLNSGLVFTLGVIRQKLQRMS